MSVKIQSIKIEQRREWPDEELAWEPKIIMRNHNNNQ